MPLNKTACRRSARVATCASSAANGRTKALVSTTAGKTSKTSRVQVRKSTKIGNGPKVPRQTPRHQEESEMEVGEEKDVSSDEAVEGNTNTVGSAQGRERLSTLRAKDGTRGEHRNKKHPRDLYWVQTHREPPASNRCDGAAVYVVDHWANASTWREPRQPTASSWQEAASFGQRGARPLRQPHVSTVHVVHELCDCDARLKRFIVINEEEQQDQLSGRPGYSSKVKTGQCFRNDLTKDGHADRFQWISETSIKIVGTQKTQTSTLECLFQTAVVWISSSRCHGLIELAIKNYSYRDGRIRSNCSG